MKIVLKPKYDKIRQELINNNAVSPMNKLGKEIIENTAKMIAEALQLAENIDNKEE